MGSASRFALKRTVCPAWSLWGVRLDRTKELIALADGYRESTESWGGLLRDLRRRRAKAPVLAVGDGALGFWAALRDVWPQTKEQRDWVHKMADVSDALPKSVQPTGRKMLNEIKDAENCEHAREAASRFDAELGDGQGFQYPDRS